MTHNHSSAVPVMQGPLRYLPTTVAAVILLWLTLTPEPLSYDEPIFWPGFDKCAHLLIMGFVTTFGLTDTFRRRRFRWLPAICVVVAMILLAGAIELLQDEMNWGRACELDDWVAGIFGIVSAAAAWCIGRLDR